MSNGDGTVPLDRPVSASGTVLRCDQHGRTDVRHYCKTHKTPLCDLCVTDIHRSCKDVVPIEKMMKKLGKGKNLKKFTTNLDELKQSLKRLKKKRQSDHSKLRHDTDEAVKDIKKFRRDITEVLDHLERKGNDYIERRYKSLGKTISDDIASLEAMINAVEDLQESMTKLSEPSETLAGMNDGSKIVSAAQELIDELKEKRDGSDIVKFKVDPKVESFAMRLNWYGKDRTFLSFEPPVSLPHLYTAKLDGQFDIRTKGDKNVSTVAEICPLQDGTILLMDVTNNKVKRMDVSCKIVEFIDLPHKPSALCQLDTSPQSVAVCMSKPCSSSSLIYLLDVETTMNQTGQIELPHTCCSIACVDNNLYVSTGNAVLVYTKDGAYIQDLYKGSNTGSVSQILRGDGDKLYVVDANIGLMTLDVTGDVLHTILDGDVRNPCSLCLDHHGQVFMSTPDRNVIQVGHDNQKLGNILTDSKELKNIASIGYDRINSRLVIARSVANFIKVMELK